MFLGLDNAGKTSLVNQAAGLGATSPEPTEAFNVVDVTRKKVEFNVVDVAGSESTRALWRHQYDQAEAVVFVVDSADQERIESARDELHKAMKDANLVNALLLVYANKQDLDGALAAQDVTQKLSLAVLDKKITWHVQACSGATGEGVEEGLNWLSQAFKDRAKAEKNK